LQYEIPATSSSYYINSGISEVVGSCKKCWKTCPTHNAWIQV